MKKKSSILNWFRQRFSKQNSNFNSKDSFKPSNINKKTHQINHNTIEDKKNTTPSLSPINNIKEKTNEQNINNTNINNQESPKRDKKEQPKELKILSKPTSKSFNEEKEKGRAEEVILEENETIILEKPKTIILEKNDEINLVENGEIETTNDNIFEEKSDISNDIIIKTNALGEIEKIIQKNYYKIQEIQYELKILEQQEKDEVLTDEINKLIDELNAIRKRFEQIKKEFWQSNYEEIYKFPNNDNYISHLIEEYKASLKNNDNNTSLLAIKEIQEYINIINDIIDIEKRKDVIEEKLENKKEKLGIRDNDFEDFKDNCIDIDKINNYVASFVTEQDYIIKDIESKVNMASNITKTAEYKTELAINYTRLLTSTLLLATTSLIPNTRRGNMLKIGLMFASVAGLSSAIRLRTKESKVTTKVTFIDYAKEIRSSINNVSDMSLMIDKTMLDIKFLKEEFKKDFGEYKNSIKEYYDIITKLDTIEKDLIVRQQIVKEYNTKLNKTLNKNNVKVKRLEEEYPN